MHFDLPLLRSLIKIKKRSGPRTELHATPQSTGIKSELDPLRETICLWSDK